MRPWSSPLLIAFRSKSTSSYLLQGRERVAFLRKRLALMQFHSHGSRIRVDPRCLRPLGRSDKPALLPSLGFQTTASGRWHLPTDPQSDGQQLPRLVETDRRKAVFLFVAVMLQCVRLLLARTDHTRCPRCSRYREESGRDADIARRPTLTPNRSCKALGWDFVKPAPTR